MSLSRRCWRGGGGNLVNDDVSKRFEGLIYVSVNVSCSKVQLLTVMMIPFSQRFDDDDEDDDASRNTSELS